MIRLDLQREKNLPKNLFQLSAYNLQNHKYFEYFITFCILLSVILMAMKYYQMPPEYGSKLEFFGNLLTFIYNIEALIKIIALESYYFINNWNRFDFSIVLVADISIIFDTNIYGSMELDLCAKQHKYENINNTDNIIHLFVFDHLWLCLLNYHKYNTYPQRS